MNQKITPLAALLVAIGILAVIGCFYLYRSSQSAKDVEDTAKRGEDRGKMMMQHQQPSQAPASNGPPSSRGAMGHVMGEHP